MHNNKTPVPDNTCEGLQKQEKNLREALCNVLSLLGRGTGLQKTAHQPAWACTLLRLHCRVTSASLIQEKQMLKIAQFIQVFYGWIRRYLSWTTVPEMSPTYCEATYFSASVLCTILLCDTQSRQAIGSERGHSHTEFEKCVHFLKRVCDVNHHHADTTPGACPTNPLGSPCINTQHINFSPIISL